MKMTKFQILPIFGWEIFSQFLTASLTDFQRIDLVEILHIC